jgi:hypothetical protein
MSELLRLDTDRLIRSNIHSYIGKKITAQLNLERAKS